jgi:hypothetical protein
MPEWNGMGGWNLREGPRGGVIVGCNQKKDSGGQSVRIRLFTQYRQLQPQAIYRYTCLFTHINPYQEVPSMNHKQRQQIAWEVA